MSSSYFVVVHEFKPGCAEGWWQATSKMLQDEAAMKAGTDAAHAAGFHNHTFMPSGMAGPIYCIWEGQEGKTLEDMQAFIDSDISPAGRNMIINNCYQIRLDLAGQPPYPSFFEGAESAAAPGEGKGNTFFLVHHRFRPGQAQKWWEAAAKMMGDEATMAAATQTQHDAGYHNHSFMPSGEAGPAFCVWEGKGEKTAEEFQAFIDGPSSPAALPAMNNTVYKIEMSLTGGTPPSGAFFG